MPEKEGANNPEAAESFANFVQRLDEKVAKLFSLDTLYYQLRHASDPEQMFVEKGPELQLAPPIIEYRDAVLDEASQRYGEAYANLYDKRYKTVEKERQGFAATLSHTMDGHLARYARSRINDRVSSEFITKDEVEQLKRIVRRLPFSERILQHEADEIRENFVETADVVVRDLLPGVADEHTLQVVAWLYRHYGSDRFTFPKGERVFSSVDLYKQRALLESHFQSATGNGTTRDPYRAELMDALAQRAYNRQLVNDSGELTYRMDSGRYQFTKAVKTVGNGVGATYRTAADHKERIARTAVVSGVAAGTVLGGAAQVAHAAPASASVSQLIGAMNPSEAVLYQQGHIDIDISGIIPQQATVPERQSQVVIDRDALLSAEAPVIIPTQSVSAEGLTGSEPQAAQAVAIGNIDAASDVLVEQLPEEQPEALPGDLATASIQDAARNIQEHFQSVQLPTDEREKLTWTLTALDAMAERPDLYEGLSENMRANFTTPVDGKYIEARAGQILGQFDSGIYAGYSAEQLQHIANLWAIAESRSWDQTRLDELVPPPPPPPPVEVISPESVSVPDADEIVKQATEKLSQRGPEWNHRAIAMRYFIEHGFTPEQAAGLIGNFVVESGGTQLDPAVKQFSGGPGRGIVQWEGPRREHLEDFAEDRGKTWDESLMLQLDFVMWEFENTETNAFRKLKKADSVREATDVVLNKFERPAKRIIEPRLEHAEDTLRGYNEQVEAIHAEVAAAQEAARIAAEQAAEAQRKAAEEEAKRAAEAAKQSGAEIEKGLKEKYGEVSGKLSKDELAATRPVIDSHKEEYLHPTALEALGLLNEAFKAEFGESMILNDAYRSLEEQKEVKADWTAKGDPGKAAKPGTSGHGWGLNVDLDNMSFDGKQYKWLRQKAPDYGWDNPGWAREGGSNPEAWHWEYVG